MKMNKLTGKCLCGAIVYEIEGEIESIKQSPWPIASLNTK